MKAFILAAGYGTRMRPLTEHTPKPLLRVGPYCLLEHLIRALAVADFQEILINTAHLGDQIEHQFKDGSKWGVTIDYSREEQPLETGGAIVRALPKLGSEPFLLVNGDVFTNYQFAQLKNRMPDFAHLVLTDTPSFKEQGDFGLHNGLVTTSETALTYTGIGVYNPNYFRAELSHFSDGNAFALGPQLRAAAPQGMVTGEYFSGEWNDIGTPQRLEALNRRYQEGSLEAGEAI